MLLKMLFRTIRKSLGRYLAITAIIALGVGFFAGLRVTEPAMKKTADAYIQELHLYDFRLISTLGFTEEDVSAFAALPGIEQAVGSISADCITLTADGADAVLHAHSLTNGINALDLTAGRLPTAATECVLDAEYASPDMLGQRIVLSPHNDEDTRAVFAYGEYTVVGLANAVNYLSYERGNTPLAGGTVTGFMYLLPSGFTSDVYTEMYLSLPTASAVFSTEYTEAVDRMRTPVETLLSDRADALYRSIYDAAATEIADAAAMLDKQKQAFAEAETALADGRAQYAAKRTETDAALKAKKSALDAARKELDAGWAALTKAKHDPSAMLPAVKMQLAAQEAALTNEETQYAEGLAAYDAAAEDAAAARRRTEQQLAQNAETLAAQQPLIAEAEGKLADSRAQLAKLQPPTVYTLDRSQNSGYVSLENDTAIVTGVAKVFPLFFFLVAALVCITTMTRMVSEKRTESGILAALGYGNGTIVSQYLIYAGSASVIGCITGFLLGSRLLPLALWQVYRILYTIRRPIAFVLDWKLCLICTLSYLICALGTTWFVCARDLRENAAQQMRPKTPTAGKRVMLEHIPFLWKRLKFLHKVSVRNILRYKKRMVMMLIGIGGCTALLLTGFGIRDSIQPIMDYQYDEITLYDAQVRFLKAPDTTAFADAASPYANALTFVHTDSVQVAVENGEKSVHMVVFDTPPDNFIGIHDADTPLSWPKNGETVVNYRFAAENDIAVGDVVTVRDTQNRTLSLTVTGIFDNYLHDYLYVNAASCQTQWGAAPPNNTAYVLFPDEIDPHAAGAALLAADNVSAVTLSVTMREQGANMLDSLNYIVLIVLVCAGALAFIVLYNLTNITITERSREIATLKVLGFYPAEQNAYVFRENLLLTAGGALCGIPLGLALLHYVMAQININTLYFGCRLAPRSYFFAVLLTLLFTVIVDALLTFKTRRIDMAQAMKAIE